MLNLPFPSSLWLVNERKVERGVRIDVGRTDKTCGYYMRSGERQ